MLKLRQTIILPQCLPLTDRQGYEMASHLLLTLNFIPWNNHCECDYLIKGPGVDILVNISKARASGSSFI